MKSNIIPLENGFNKKISVLGFGHFNTIHPGHIRYLRYAKKKKGIFAIALIGDGFSKDNQNYNFNQKERAEALNLLSIVDYIFTLKDSELDMAVKKLKPEVLILGNEFEKTTEESIKNAVVIQNQEKRNTTYYGGQIIYASTDLLISSEIDLDRKRKMQFRSTCIKTGLNKVKLLNSLNQWKNSKLIVLGDTIVDQYAACEALGISAEAPVVVVKELETKNFIGGAAIVASHIKALGAQCDFISVVGHDENAKLIEEEIFNQNIGCHLIRDNSRPTTFKKRYIVENQKLFRVSKLEDHSIDEKIELEIIKKLKMLAPNAQGIVISDFVYGLITKRIISVIKELAKKYNLLLFGDLQCSSQVGSILKFKNFSLLCPNEREARLAMGDKDSGLELLSQKLIEKTSSERLIMKLGAEGFISYERLKSGNVESHPFPALTVNPLDVTGAGDSLLAAMSSGLSSGQKMMETSALGCCIAGLAVTTMGNSPINKNNLENFVEDIFL